MTWERTNFHIFFAASLGFQDSLDRKIYRTHYVSELIFLSHFYAIFMREYWVLLKRWNLKRTRPQISCQNFSVRDIVCTYYRYTEIYTLEITTGFISKFLEIKMLMLKFDNKISSSNTFSSTFDSARFDIFWSLGPLMRIILKFLLCISHGNMKYLKT